MFTRPAFQILNPARAAPVAAAQSSARARFPSRAAGPAPRPRPGARAISSARLSAGSEGICTKRGYKKHKRHQTPAPSNPLCAHPRAASCGSQRRISAAPAPAPPLTDATLVPKNPAAIRLIRVLRRIKNLAARLNSSKSTPLKLLIFNGLQISQIALAATRRESPASKREMPCEWAIYTITNRDLKSSPCYSSSHLAWDRRCAPLRTRGPASPSDLTVDCMPGRSLCSA